MRLLRSCWAVLVWPAQCTFHQAEVTRCRLALPRCKNRSTLPTLMIQTPKWSEVASVGVCWAWRQYAAALMQDSSGHDSFFHFMGVPAEPLVTGSDRHCVSECLCGGFGGLSVLAIRARTREQRAESRFVGWLVTSDSDQRAYSHRASRAWTWTVVTWGWGRARVLTAAAWLVRFSAKVVTRSGAQLETRVANSTPNTKLVSCFDGLGTFL